MAKMQCYEFMKCGLENDPDACPAISQSQTNRCWRIAGTMCGGKVQGTFAEKLGNCQRCGFYQYMGDDYKG